MSSTTPTTTPTAPALRPAQSLLVGSLMFGLFFGAGNLIFPVQMGRDAGGAWVPAAVGFLVTAVGLAVLGIMASALSGARNVLEMTSPVGRRYALAFTCALYLTIGPAFAIPRTATVSFEVGVAGSLPAGLQRPGLAVFTVVFFAATALVALRPGRLVDWVGRWLTPLFLVLLAALVGAAAARPMTSGALPAPTGPYATSPLLQGLLDGYSTMDALGSLAFAILVVEAVRSMGVTRPGAVAREVARGGLITVVAMSAIYVSLAYVGATSLAAVPDAANGGAVLAGVSHHYYGTAGQVLIAAIVLVACLKTAAGLVAACAQMFTVIFPGRLSHRAWVLAFTVVSCAVANLGLAAIVAWSVPVLVFLYPLAVTAIVLGLLSRWVGHRPLVHRVTTSLVGGAAVLDLVRALPVRLPGGDAVVRAAGVLPGYDQGFGWVLPALVGLVAGLALSSRPAAARPV